MEKVKLSSICNIASGGTPARSNSSYWKNGTIPWVKIGDITDKFLSQTSEHITQEGLNTSSAKLFSKGTILYTIFATLGEVAILNIDATTNQAIAGICLNDSRFTIQYLYYYLTSLKDYVNNIGRGVAQNNINLSILKNFEIPLRTLSEQEHIVESLTRVEQIIKHRRAQLAKLDELVKCRFVEMFGDCRSNPKQWGTKKLDEIASVGSSKRVFVEELIDGGIPFYRGTEVGALAEGQNITPELFISESHYRELCKASGKPVKGDLLMPSICPDGRIWIVDSDSPFYFKDGRVLWVHDIHENFNPIFLQYSLKDRIISDYASIASGTTFAELKIFTLKSCKIFDVPLPLQDSFAIFVRHIDKLRISVQAALEKAQTLFDSLMQEYFG